MARVRWTVLLFGAVVPSLLPTASSAAVAISLLEVLCEGRVAALPPAVEGLRVFHRAGQTFITWKEIDPLTNAEKLPWGQIKEKLNQSKDTCTYRIYVHDKPITARTILEARLVGEVGPLSGYNCNGRNPEYLIGQAMVKPDQVGELAKNSNDFIHTWDMDHPRMDRYPVGRLVIDEKTGPLPPGVGLYVHQAASAGQRYYAVVACRNGIENTVDFSEANALVKPVREVAGPGEPVRQGDGLWGPYFDYPGKRVVYVQWAAPPLAPHPNMYFNWSILIPPGTNKLASVELYFHSGNYSYAKPNVKFLAGSIQIAPHDYPFSGWFGYNEAHGTLKSYATGMVGNHTQRRVIAFMDWAKDKFPIDPERIVAVGGDGAAAMALSYPDRFSSVLITNFQEAVLHPKNLGPFVAAWGPRSPMVKDEEGRGDWAWAELDKQVLAKPGRDLPLFICRGGSWGRVKGWGKGRGRFYAALQQTRQPLSAHWAWGGILATPDRYTGLWRGLDLSRRTPVPAISNSSADREGEGSGNYNNGYSWKDIVDRPDGFQLTVTGPAGKFDLTPRRVNEFKVKPGERVHWEAKALPAKNGRASPSSQQGDVIVDPNGLITVEKLSLTAGGVIVKLSRGKSRR
jgi:hypothetical protein